MSSAQYVPWVKGDNIDVRRNKILFTYLYRYKGHIKFLRFEWNHVFGVPKKFLSYSIFFLPLKLSRERSVRNRSKHNLIT